jgi:hypothetical protein
VQKHIEKHLVVDISVLDLKMVYVEGSGSLGHVYGPFILHLLGSHRIRTATRRLQVHLLRPAVMLLSAYIIYISYNIFRMVLAETKN